jgi:hypothetical protein
MSAVSRMHCRTQNRRKKSGEKDGRFAEVRGLTPDVQRLAPAPYFLLFSPSLYMYLIAGL